ncbi:hypothetical protein RND81_12G067500 [Saponaria officinalis]|uniref:Zinc finger GRF-type domain-containing protein n=1 Tax=Saponaria officinalis TaxID=3572 RepID=A0AAW1H7F5_SAPOF
MSSSAFWRNTPVAGLQFRTQACTRCGRNTVIKISESTSNPRKAYFKCLECDHFVMWVGKEHVILTRAFKVPGRNEVDEVSSNKVLMKT